MSLVDRIDGGTFVFSSLRSFPVCCQMMRNHVNDNRYLAPAMHRGVKREAWVVKQKGIHVASQGLNIPSQQ